MSAFDPPFATNGELRAPTPTEKSLGFPCGPASQALFNFLINRLEGQVDNIADQAGITAAAEDDATVLYRAVDALIAAAIGSGDTSNFVLFTQARTRLPIFPDVQNTAGTIVVTAPSTGTVRVPASVNFLHRGIFLITTTQTDFSTDPSKTYHLRWNPTDGFVLRDLASGTYNPSALAETNIVFDTTYDDMLVARVVTNSSNVATITPLSNKSRLQITDAVAATNIQQPLVDNARGDVISTLNWSRTPVQRSWSYLVRSQQGTWQTDFDETMFELGGFPSTVATNIPATRYRIAFTMLIDFVSEFTMAITAEA
jgi:hypothetical protein